MPAASYIDPRNERAYPLDVPRWCSDERTPLLITPGTAISRDEIDGRTRSLRRYRAAFPVDIAKAITLAKAVRLSSTRLGSRRRNAREDSGAGSSLIGCALAFRALMKVGQDAK